MINYLEQNRASDNYSPKLASMRWDADQTVRRGRPVSRVCPESSLARVIPGQVIPGQVIPGWPARRRLGPQWPRPARWASRHAPVRRSGHRYQRSLCKRQTIIRSGPTKLVCRQSPEPTGPAQCDRHKMTDRNAQETLPESFPGHSAQALCVMSSVSIRVVPPRAPSGACSVRRRA